MLNVNVSLTTVQDLMNQTILFAASYTIKDKLDLHVASRFIYWTDNSTYSSYRGIYRARTDGGYYSNLITSGIGTGGIQGIAVDWIAGKKHLIHLSTHLSNGP